MARHWAKWMPKPSPAGVWLVAVFAADQPTGQQEVALRLDDGTTVNASVDATHAVRVRNGVWACPTAEHMTIKTVPACPSCGQPSRLPMASGGNKHECARREVKRTASSGPSEDDATLF